MNRRHNIDTYRSLVDRLRHARSDIAFSSDFIVGFPGESDTDFQSTIDLVDEIGFISAYSFKYSARPGTPAAAIPDQVPDKIKSERLRALQRKLTASQAAFNSTTVGSKMPILLDGHGRYPGQLVGRSPYMQAVHVSAPTEELGNIVNLRIVAAHPNSLAARYEGENSGKAIT